MIILMIATVPNTIELTSKQYLYFREELFRRATPWEKRASFPFSDQITVEDRGSSLRFRFLTMRRYIPYWDIHVIHSVGQTRIEWSVPTLPWWVRLQMILVLSVFGFLGINLYIINTRGPGNGPQLVFLGSAVVATLGIFSFFSYVRGEANRQMHTLLTEAARVACQRSVTATGAFSTE